MNRAFSLSFLALLMTLAVLLLLLLSACGSTAPARERIVYREVIKPVPVPCLTEAAPGHAPRETDALDLQTATLTDKVKAILIDRERDKVADLNQRSLLKACEGAPARPPPAPLDLNAELNRRR